MYEIKVTVEVPGLPEALTALASALSNGRPAAVFSQNSASTANADKSVEVPQKVQENPTAPAVTPSTSAPVESASGATTGPVTVSSPSKSYSLDDLSRAGATLIDQGKMPQLLELLKKYGVQAVTQLDPATYPAFVEEMKALGAQL